jgi:hypothetical protein
MQLKMPALKFFLMVPLFASAVVAIAGCGGGDPVGTWELDKDATAPALIAAVADDPDAPPMAAAMVAELLAKTEMTLTLNADGTASMSRTMPVMFGQGGGREAYAGTWSGTGSEIAFQFPGDRKHPELAASVSGDLLTVTLERDKPPLIFRKGGAG